MVCDRESQSQRAGQRIARSYVQNAYERVKQSLILSANLRLSITAIRTDVMREPIACILACERTLYVT